VSPIISYRTGVTPRLATPLHHCYHHHHHHHHHRHHHHHHHHRQQHQQLNWGRVIVHVYCSKLTNICWTHLSTQHAHPHTLEHYCLGTLQDYMAWHHPTKLPLSCQLSLCYRVSPSHELWDTMRTLSSTTTTITTTTTTTTWLTVRTVCDDDDDDDSERVD